MRARESDVRSRHFADARRPGHLDPVDGERPAELLLVDLAIAANEHRDRAAVHLEEKRLDELRGVTSEELGYVLHRGLSGRRDLFQRLRVVPGRRLVSHSCGLRPTRRRGVAAAGTAEHHALARVGQHHELVADVAADLARRCLHVTERQTAAGEDPTVRLAEVTVGRVQGGLVGVERIGVLHGELAAAHDAEAWADLVAELRLDLVERERKLAVRSHFVPHEIGDDLLVRGPQRVLSLVTVGEPHHERAVQVPAAGLLPELRRGEDRQHELDRSDPIDLLAHDRVDLEDHPLTQRQVRVDPPCHLPQQAGPHHEAVADHLCVGGIFLERGNEGAGPAHGGAMYPAARWRC